MTLAQMRLFLEQGAAVQGIRDKQAANEIAIAVSKLFGSSE